MAIAKFDWQASLVNPKKIEFKDLSVTSGAQITNWNWKFGDGTTSTLQNPTHEYAAPGIYEVCLSIRAVSATGKACEASYCFKVTIQGASDCLAVAKFDWKASSANAKKVEFKKLKKGELEAPKKGEKISDAEFQKLMAERLRETGGRPMRVIRN